MALLDILEYPNPALKREAAPVEEFDEELRELADDLFETLYASGGIGLSAPQANIAKRVLVMDLSGERTAPQLFINPKIVARDRPAIVEESCLSVPGFVGKVVRSTRVKVEAQDASGRRQEYDLEDMAAVCLQHELDHLDGKLFIDRLPLLKRLWVRSTLSRAAKQRAASPRTSAA